MLSILRTWKGEQQNHYYWSCHFCIMPYSLGNRCPLLAMLFWGKKHEGKRCGVNYLHDCMLILFVHICCSYHIFISFVWMLDTLLILTMSLAELRGLDLQTGSFTLRQIKAATNNFDYVNKIGEGGFGSVYKVFCLTVLHWIPQLLNRTKRSVIIQT